MNEQFALDIGRILAVISVCFESRSAGRSVCAEAIVSLFFSMVKNTAQIIYFLPVQRNCFFAGAHFS